MYICLRLFFFFFFNDTATTEIYTLSLHDALPISERRRAQGDLGEVRVSRRAVRNHHRDAHADRPDPRKSADARLDRKSTRLNSSHLVISYAVFCLKKKKKYNTKIDKSSISKHRDQ